MFKKGLRVSATASFAVFLSVMATQVPAQTASYNFSPVNQHDINLTAAYWNPIIAYVSEKSGVKINLKIGRTSADTTSYVLAKEVEFVFSNHLFSPEREQLGWKVFGRRQGPALQSQIVVPEDSPISNVSQLEGQDVAFAGKEAFVIYKVAYAHLLAKKITVNPVFAGNQNAAFAQLFSGKVKAAGGNSQLVEAFTQRENKKFKVLWSSEPFLDLALMVSGKVPERDAKAVADAFINMSKDSAGREILHDVSKRVGLAQDAYFISATNADYASYRRFYQTAPAALH